MTLEKAVLNDICKNLDAVAEGVAVLTAIGDELEAEDLLMITEPLARIQAAFSLTIGR